MFCDDAFIVPDVVETDLLRGDSLLIGFSAFGWSAELAPIIPAGQEFLYILEMDTATAPCRKVQIYERLDNRILSSTPRR